MSPTSRRFEIQSTQPGGSVLDELTGVQPAAAAVPADAAAPPDSRPSRSPQPGAVTRSPQRVPIRVQVPAELADRVRAAVAALAYQDSDWSSLNEATAAALEQFVAAAEAKHNGGEPFPWRPGRKLQPGRRVGY
jgi:hypothetical protein